MSMLDMGFNENRNYIQNEIEILNQETTSELTIEKILNDPEKNNLYLLKLESMNLYIIEKY